ncbi:hypothetical protein PG999_013287 [Apiospora kogelbergensis]|uniref:Uncharacterized protein n=2 Tax=Apiospora kogelbergensis TaxID=1337665 RepID=A0AAW0Q6Z5_9PEZI
MLRGGSPSSEDCYPRIACIAHFTSSAGYSNLSPEEEDACFISILNSNSLTQQASRDLHSLAVRNDMALAWRPFTAATAVVAYTLVSRQAEWSSSRFVKIFCGLELSAVFLWVVWTILLYPKFFSPLRHLPSPPGARSGMAISPRYPRALPVFP